MKNLIVILTLFFFISCNQSNKSRIIENSNFNNDVFTTYEFYGNYLPTKEIKVKKYLLNGIEISTKEINGKYKIDLICLRFTDLNTKEYYCVDKIKFKGDKSNFTLEADDPVIGTIKISGMFFGDRGPMFEKYSESEKIAFKGKFEVSGIINQTFECRYFEGD